MPLRHSQVRIKRGINWHVTNSSLIPSRPTLFLQQHLWPYSHSSYTSPDTLLLNQVKMICLSKADEGSLRHLKWNQSPPPLAAQHTTCQDLNGMANLREHIGAGLEDSDGGGGGLLGADSGGQLHDENHRVKPGPLDAGRWYRGTWHFHCDASHDANCVKQSYPRVRRRRLAVTATIALLVAPPLRLRDSLDGPPG